MDSLLLHTHIIGEGEPIVFLHTGLQTGLTDFEFQRDYFKKEYKVILPDLRGHGESYCDDFEDYFEKAAADLLETLDYYELDQVHIVGCSLGALVSLPFARRFPNRIKSLTVSGVIPRKPTNWGEIHKKEVDNQSLFLQNEEATNYYDQLHSSDWRQFIYMGRKEDWYPFEETKEIPLRDIPVLYMVGEGNEHEKNGAILYPQAHENIHVAIIPFASHLVHAEQPKIYTHILEEFLNRGCK